MNIEIREALDKDIPEIVRVLKASLGEEELQLSEEVWRYKHIDNPFGRSIVLIALENDKIIGVRAFMRWKWQHVRKDFSALRAVDTATHPDHQGKGIFKKLTLHAVKIAKESGDHFVFNTPNEQSRPGYLKMGWKRTGKIFVGLKPSLSFLSIVKVKQEYNIEKQVSDKGIEHLCVNWNQNLSSKDGLFTPKSKEFLSWRYEDNPLQKYEIFAGNGYYLAAYVKKRGSLKEFRISESLYDQTLVDKNQLKKIINKLSKRFKCHLISFSPNLIEIKGSKGNFGPVLTLNPLNLNSKEEEHYLKIMNWNNSLGDLELF